MSGGEIVIHSLDHARAALAAAAALRVPVTVASAPGAAAQAGPGWFKAVVAEAQAAYPDTAVTAILDCGDEPGAVMAALRAGLTALRFGGAAETRAKLEATGAHFIPPSSSDATLDLLEARDANAACHAFLAAR